MSEEAAPADELVTCHADLLRLTGTRDDEELVGHMRARVGYPAGLDTSPDDSVDIEYAGTSDYLVYPFRLSEFWTMLTENYEANMAARADMAAMDDDDDESADAQRLWFPLDESIALIEHTLAAPYHRDDVATYSQEADYPDEPPLLIFSSHDGVYLMSNGINDGGGERDPLPATTTDGLALIGFDDHMSEATLDAIDLRITRRQRRLDNARLSPTLLQPLRDALGQGFRFFVLETTSAALTFQVGFARTRQANEVVCVLSLKECIPVVNRAFRRWPD